VEDLRNALLQRAFCYDDPAAYRAGVDAALAAVSDALSSSEVVVVADEVERVAASNA
jgi:hypothetical protein